MVGHSIDRCITACSSLSACACFWSWSWIIYLEVFRILQTVSNFWYLGKFYHHFMIMVMIHQSPTRQLQQLPFWQHPLQVVSLAFTASSVKITIGGIKSILIRWRGGQMIIKKTWRARMNWRIPTTWPWISGLASRAGLTPNTGSYRKIWLVIIIGAGAVIGGYTHA